jgi:hypothetical protein
MLSEGTTMTKETEVKTRQALIGTPKSVDPKVKNAATVGWLQQCIHRSRNEVFTEMKTVTPAFAEVLLSNNPDNRKIRPIKFDQLVADMKAGRYVFNGEPIIIAKTGELNDGQHRLAALVQAKVCIPMLFVFGVERETRTTVDQGATRGAGDYLHMDNVPNATQQASIARWLIAYETTDTNDLGGRGRITPAQVTDRVLKDKTILTSTRYAQNHAVQMKKYTSVTVIGFCHNVLLRENVHDGMAFMHMLCTGEDIRRGDGAYAARERLLNMEHKHKGQAVEVIFRAWNAYREKREINKIPIHGRLPELV